MIVLKETLQLHEMLTKKFGGRIGVRDNGALEVALNRPFATFGGHDLYPDALHKAAALMESTLMNRPFVDGNKRTGYVLMRLLLLQAGKDVVASQQEKFDFVMAIAKGELKFEGIVGWLEAHQKA